MSGYLRIVEDLRRQIDRGELAVGDRAPTTREVAERWKVATATAARALRTLADQGVLRVVPRVGSIVAGHKVPGTAEAPGARRERDLSRASIVRAGLAIADGEGIGALSLRAVAAKVGVPVMSIHRHVPDKDELLRLMTEAALAEEPLPVTPPRGWRAQLEVAARTEWRGFRRHPWLARVMNVTRPEPLPSAIAYADWIFRALGETGADPATQMRLHVILHGYVQGIAVNLETEADVAGETGVSDVEWMLSRSDAFAKLAASGRYPSFAKVLGGLGTFDLDFDTLFEMGLAALLDGFAASLARGAHPAP